MRSSLAALLPLLALPVLVACGGEDGDDGASATTSSSSPTTEKEDSASPSPTPTPSESPSESPDAAGTGQVPRPAPGTCEQVPESPDGVYDLGELGEVTLRTDGSALTFDVRSGGGWATSVNSTPGRAEVEFSRGDEVVDFGADLAGDQLVIEVCDGDAD
ncbi:hypothetical protein [Blastococcus sp. CCUG 61487]|uniref:hypothetical protein n=1 Tax=Blastococcus sp. CCUG 61487 TaxID=1840703 RepID=UPI0010C145AC|nr:hypothetical protein [Blastococcus sp. CCUG 61487]TKJ21526.1 hypothetical protein A6V29_07520 [Blastococcus sp. CCUG 61487]